jgi:hypothetical protein
VSSLPRLPVVGNADCETTPRSPPAAPDDARQQRRLEIARDSEMNRAGRRLLARARRFLDELREYADRHDGTDVERAWIQACVLPTPEEEKVMGREADEAFWALTEAANGLTWCIENSSRRSTASLSDSFGRASMTRPTHPRSWKGGEGWRTPAKPENSPFPNYSSNGGGCWPGRP